MPTIVSKFFPTAPQWHFLQSDATVRGYGGAMGGGKSRTICEAVLDYAIDYPGIQILVARQRHTSIIETTRRTFMKEVLGVWPKESYRKKESQGEDWVELCNGSRLNFIGLDDTVKWFSSEIGVLVLDEAHEIAESDVIDLMTRLRQRGMPHKTLIAFNPGNPGHWLQEWFILGAAQTDFGFRKEELYYTDAEAPCGSAEFVFANAYANPYLPEDYIKRTLASLPAVKKQRLLHGMWVLTDGSLFFDEEALTEYAGRLERPWRQGTTAGDVVGGNREDPVRVKVDKHGPLAVFRPPVRDDPGKGRRAHRYLVAMDPSSGGAADFCGVQVIDVTAFEQAAELQVKVDPDLAAVEAFRLAAIYNGALIAVETTGGWGHTAIQAVEKLQAGWRGDRSVMPRLWRRRVYDRVTKGMTDILGWDTNTKTRMAMLDKLEEVLRERDFGLFGQRTHTELTQFAWPKNKAGGLTARPPQAVSGKHDDLTMSLAMGVYISASLPRELRRPVEEPHAALVGSTGY